MDDVELLEPCGSPSSTPAAPPSNGYSYADCNCNSNALPLHRPGNSELHAQVSTHAAAAPDACAAPIA